MVDVTAQTDRAISPKPVQAEARVHPDVEPLREKALESVQLAIELFNRPHECARSETVLMLFHHGFEMILNSMIVEKLGTASDEDRGYSYGFDMCLRLAEEELGVVTKDHRRFLSMLDNLRDSTVHYYQEVSERILYIFAQASVSLFNDLIRKATGRGLLDFLPSRVLPISAIPPQQLARVLDDEFNRLCEVLQKPGIPKQRAMAMLRPLMAFKVGGEEQHRRMTTAELEVAIENLSAADNWRVVFPEIAKVQFESDGGGINVGFKVVKDLPDALPVRVLKPGDPEPPQGVIIQKEVNIFDKFNMGLHQLASKLGISGPRTLAMIRYYELEKDSEAYREVKIGSSVYKRYSKRALDHLRDKLGTVRECWERHGRALSGRKKRLSKKLR